VETSAAVRSAPRHVGLILDGNRRWARKGGRPQLEGHREGYKNLHSITRRAMECGVEFVSAYVFSVENWNRSQEEVDYLMDLLVWVATKEITKYQREGIRIVFLGSRNRLSKRVVEAVESAELKTQSNDRLTLALCLNYSGEMELAEGVSRLVADGVPADQVTPQLLTQYLYHPEIPPIDLIIRTSGEQRLSNFMLWRASYAELYFSPKHWPEFTPADFDEALAEYARRQRRFGK
jgi:undecaprenyl diphosphate synthase